MAEKRLAAPEEVQQKFQAMAEDILESVPELRSLTLVLDWKMGEESFPAGLYHAREKEPIGPSAITAKSRQLLKVMFSQLHGLAELLTAVESKVKASQESVGPQPEKG